METLSSSRPILTAPPAAPPRSRARRPRRPRPAAGPPRWFWFALLLFLLPWAVLGAYFATGALGLR